MKKIIQILEFALKRQGFVIGTFKITTYPYNPRHRKRLKELLRIGAEINHSYPESLKIDRVDWDNMEIHVHIKHDEQMY